MKFIKKLITFMLAGSLLFSMSSCTSNTGETENLQNAEKTSSEAGREEAAGESSAQRNISEDIHIDQIGYKNNDKKVAVIKGQHSSFSVVDVSTDKIVLSKELNGKVNDESSGDTVSYADFSELTSSGQYCITVSGLGKSYDFKIGDNTLYANVSDALLKALYYQRCGMALTSQYAGEYTHEICHDSSAKLYGDESKEIDVNGGWHDAGDYGRYVVPAAVTAADLLLAYEYFPDSFAGKINIPESTNNIPDILDEAKYGIEWMLKMQDQETGGVYHKVTSRNFPDIKTKPEKDVDELLVLPVSSTATGDFAAVTAMAARIFKDIDPAFSARCLQASIKAWGWLEANTNFTAFKNPADIASGEYGDDSDKDERNWAAAELFRTTGDEEYSKYFTGNYQTEGFGLGWQNVSGFAAISYMLSDSEKADKQKVEDLKKSWLEKADMFAATAEKDGYLLAMHKMEYNWGSNMNVSNHAMHLLIANRLSNNAKYTEAAENCAHYLLGRNTLNKSYITGFGSNQVMHPHHRPSEGDGITNPVPGFVAGGPDSGLEDEKAGALLKGKAPAQCYIDDVLSYSTNEVATYWNSPAIFLFAYMKTVK